MELKGVREHGEHDPVSLVIEPESGRMCIRALNEGGNRDTFVDLWDLVEYLRVGPVSGRTPEGFSMPLGLE
jgi:hypothetical protein